ncbi:MAG: PIN domain-containing protein [Caldilineaceae bacterium]|nr:PIN domain-containing protein [Caldilineaceae bacterium]
MGVHIVVDTSVLISALIGSNEPSRRVIHRCLAGNYLPLIRNALFLEYVAVSSRERILARCPLSATEVRELLNAFYHVHPSASRVRQRSPLPRPRSGG